MWIAALADEVARVLALNAVSLVCGVVGNIFLLFNFTQSVRYIIALPVTILTWLLATGIVSRWMSILVEMPFADDRQ